MLSQFYAIRVVLLGMSWNNPSDNIAIMLEVYTSQETRVFAFWFSLIPFFPLKFKGLLFFFNIHLIVAIDSFIVTNTHKEKNKNKRESWAQYCVKTLEETYKLCHGLSVYHDKEKRTSLDWSAIMSVKILSGKNKKPKTSAWKK